jgi:hypothetical protein
LEIIYAPNFLKLKASIWVTEQVIGNKAFFKSVNLVKVRKILERVIKGKNNKLENRRIISANWKGALEMLGYDRTD